MGGMRRDCNWGIGCETPRESVKILYREKGILLRKSCVGSPCIVAILVHYQCTTLSRAAKKGVTIVSRPSYALFVPGPGVIVRMGLVLWALWHWGTVVVKHETLFISNHPSLPLPKIDLVEE